MRLELLASLILISAAFAALDQSYIHTIMPDGSSEIEKTMEITIFSNQLTATGLEDMRELCAAGSRVRCQVDVEAKTVTMWESFEPGGYYTFSSDYGIPFITHTATIEKIPTDRFSVILDRILIYSNATPPSAGGGAVRPIDLEDEEENAANAAILRRFDANITYTVVFPMQVSSASAGNVTGTVEGNRATFSLVDVLEQSRPIVVRSSELNLGYIVVILGGVALAVLAAAFFATKPMKRKK